MLCILYLVNYLCLIGFQVFSFLFFIWNKFLPSLLLNFLPLCEITWTCYLSWSLRSVLLYYSSIPAQSACAQWLRWERWISTKHKLHLPTGSLVAQTVKRLSTMQETRVRSLGWEDPMEKEMAIHSSTIAWKIPWTEEPGRLQSMGSQRVRHDWATSLPTGCACACFLSRRWGQRWRG